MVRLAVRSIHLVPALLLLVSQTSCMKSDKPPAAPVKSPARISSVPFGTLPSGEPVTLFTLTNTNGIELRAMNYGGIITSLRTPDRLGVMNDIVLGYDSVAGYLKTTPYFGAIVGRYANRIAKGRFTLDGKSYTLAVNNGKNALHGGLAGFDKVLWTGMPFDSAASGKVGVVFSYTSKDGEEGYPGALSVRVTYTLNDSDELTVEYHATTDKATPLNLSQHTYFNLAGQASGAVLGQVISINADRFTPVDSTLIPTGELRPVDGTAFDLRQPVAIGAHINDADAQLGIAGGYDHNFVLNRQGDGLGSAATVYDPASGRRMTVSTTEPGLQFYTGNFLDGTITGKGGRVYEKRNAFCLETQHFPDSPNQSSFPSTILRPGAVYTSRTVFAFSTVADSVPAAR
ncbi:MAG: galactose mutarotase [Gemmatimonadaceae bacterium]|nr:galactose mutarotase [Gemmatimonadaceae bacterium]